MRKLLLVVLGGGFGSGARYLIGGWLQPLFAALPIGTITINVTGSFIIAFIMYVSLNSNLINPDVRLMLTTGVMGGYTTYSTFNYESLQLFQRQDILFGVLNILITVFAALIAGWLGLVCGRLLVGH